LVRRMNIELFVLKKNGGVPALRLTLGEAARFHAKHCSCKGVSKRAVARRRG
jgi:hypothetical protein